jgi:prepilin-type N-terminal cleavage/methylation domain-containing protein/prepilin-type processing-associated H-X9-DG protein
MSTPLFRRSGMTLVEVLVVISIIAILASLLMPALSVVRERSRRVVCSSNFRQCGIALMAFAGDHRDALPQCQPNGIQNPDTYYVSGSGNPNLVFQMWSYLDTFKVWRCPATGAKTIDDPQNTAGIRRCSTIYWAHLSAGTSPNRFESPGRLAQQSSKSVLMQDELYKWGGAWRSNHGHGGGRKVPYPNNPALEMTFGGTPVGANVLFGDGHVTWTPFGPEFVKVYAPGPSDVYSLASALQ